MEPNSHNCTLLVLILRRRLYLALLFYSSRQHPIYPPLTYGMGRPLYEGLEACTQLEVSTRRIRLVPRCPHYEFSEGLAERTPYANGEHPWPFIQRH